MREKELEKTGAVVNDRRYSGECPAKDRPQRVHSQQQRDKQQPDPELRARKPCGATHRMSADQIGKGNDPDPLTGGVNHRQSVGMARRHRR